MQGLTLSRNLTNPYSTTNPYFSNPVTPVNASSANSDPYHQTNTATGTQTPTNTIDVRPQLQSLLSQFQGMAGNISGQVPNFSPIRLNTNFQGPEAYQAGLQNGIDYFGRMGMAEGLQNINAQRDAANRQLQTSLGQQAGNEGLLSVLQNQNLFRSNLASNPLISEAQKGTAQRIQDQVNLQNALINSVNQANLAQGTYNQQGALAQLQARMSALQPTQNLIDILTNLQGQNRGVAGTSSELGTKNFK